MNDVRPAPGVPEAQRDAVLRRYALRRRRIPVGAGTLSLVVPDDREWLRQGSWAAGVVRGEEPPYWIRIWPVAVAMARELARAESLAGLRTLDLGCGLGVPGVQAAALGAAVCFADREADALAFAAWNARGQAGCVVPPQAVCVDWATAGPPGEFDLILLSDVTYHRQHHRAVRQRVANALAPGGCVLHTDPMRELSTLFLDELRPAWQLAQWRRATSFADREVEARITIACANQADLRRWCGVFARSLDAGSLAAGSRAGGLTLGRERSAS